MKIKCDQCNLASIQGVICHEHGCPNTDRIWDGEVWCDPISEDEMEEW